MTPEFFPSPAAFRRWLRANHATETELWVGYHKVATGRPSMTWSDSVDEALCYGWIDGLRKSVDGDAYMIRFTPRKATSIWSEVNTRKIETLIAAGRMRPAGLRAFEKRRTDRAGVYAFESKAQQFTPAELAAFRKKARAWKFWEAQPPGYRRLTTHWVASAKRPETRSKRFATLVTDSAAGLRIAALRR